MPTDQRSQPDRGAVASAISATLQQAVADRAPLSWMGLVLEPPEHPERMIWHVHLAPVVHVDLLDGRAVLATPPSGGHQWDLPSGRRATVASGDPTPPPGPSSTAVRITGPHVAVELGRAEVVVRYGDRSRRPHELRSPVDALDRLADAVRDAIDAAVATKVGGSTPTLAYSPAGWQSHRRRWIVMQGH